MYPTQVQTTIVPRTINRLFITSLVLSGIILTLSISTPFPTVIGMSLFNLAIALVSIAIMTNHLVLYHLTERQRTSLSPFASNEATHPYCLFTLTNIIFTIIMAMILLGVMWLFVFIGISFISRKHYNYFGGGAGLPQLLLGITGYAESGVLIALCITYVRYRKDHLVAVSESSFGP